MDDLTPPAEIAAAAQRREERRLNAIPGHTGRPEKRDRRVLEAFLEKMRDGDRGMEP
jgi:hypothetical protein